MSICINNDLIWVSIPRCASLTIEKALLNSKLNVSLFNEIAGDKVENHMHYQLYNLYEHYGRLETVCITRDWFDRWLSALRYFWKSLKNYKLTPIIEWEDIDNDFIYEYFNKSFSDVIYNSNSFENTFLLFLKNKNNYISNENIFNLIKIFSSQNQIKCNESCTYEFDIKNINQFEIFIQNRYNIDFKLLHLNSSENIPNKIIINDELKDFIWNVFESRFEKNKKLF